MIQNMSAMLRPVGNRFSVLLFVWAALLLGVILPALITGHSEIGSYVHPATIGLTVFSGVWWASVTASNDIRVFEMVVALFVYVFLGLAPMVQQALQVTPSTVPSVDLSRIGQASAVIAWGMAGMFMGMLLGPVRGKRAPTKYCLSERRVTVLTVVSLVCAIYVIVQPGLVHLFESRRDLDQARQIAWADPSFRGALVGGTNSLLLVSVVALILMQRGSILKPSGRKLMMVVAVPVLLVLVNPLSSPRYVVGSMWLALVGALGGYGTLRRYRAVAVFAMAGIVFVFPMGNAFRYADDGSARVASPMAALTSGDFDAFYQVVNSVEYVDVGGTEGGRQVMGAALFWVPRSIWPSKPIDTGALLAKAKGYSYTNLSSPLWAEFYVDGGTPLVVLGMFWIGYWIRGADNRIQRLSSSYRLTPLLCILPFYLIIILRGSLLNAMSYFMVMVFASRFVQVRCSALREAGHS